MQQHLKYLVIEDDKRWSEAISSCTGDYFQETLSFHQSRIRPFSAYNGEQANQLLSQAKFDLVTLDMNLGESPSKSKISGLDLLGDLALSNQAYFLIIITGAVNDPTLDRLYGKEAAALMRYGAINEAVKRLPAERVRILHKPPGSNPAAAMEELRPHLFSALDQYCAVSLQRNIFRPLPGHKKLWEVRYNGGPRLTIPHIQAFEMIRSALAQPNREMKVIQLVQALVQSSGKFGATCPIDLPPAVTPLDSEDEEGLEWADQNAMSTPDHLPVDSVDGAITLETMIGALLLAQKGGLSLAEATHALAKKYGSGPVLRLPGKIREYSKDRQKAQNEFAIDCPAEKLDHLADALAPILKPYRQRYEREAEARKITNLRTRAKRSHKMRVALGRDTRELELARQHWKRARTALRKYPALNEFLTHIEYCVDRGLTAKGHINYVPTDGSDLTPFWLTD